MAHIILSIGATRKQLLRANKVEAMNYVSEMQLPAVIVSDYEELYKDVQGIRPLSGHLLGNLKDAKIVFSPKQMGDLEQNVRSVLSRLEKGVLIIDLPSGNKECRSIFEALVENQNKSVQVIVNMPSVYCWDSCLAKIHTGWRLLGSINKRDYDVLIEEVGKLDAVGLAVTGAVRDEYIKTYKNFRRKEGQPIDESINDIPFYYSHSQICCKKEVFKELIQGAMDRLKLFSIDYSTTDIEEMFL